MQLTSDQFHHNAMIPSTYSCLGKNVNPPLHMEGLPAQAKSLVLIVDDPDAPRGAFVHWVVYDIPVVSQIKPNSIPGVPGANDFGKNNYGGPCPPSGVHHYYFKLYALDTKLNLPEGQTKAQIEKAMQGHILAQAQLIGLFAAAH